MKNILYFFFILFLISITFSLSLCQEINIKSSVVRDSIPILKLSLKECIDLAKRKNNFYNVAGFDVKIGSARKTVWLLCNSFMVKTDASITSLASLKTYSEINSQIKDKINIHLSSDKLVASVVGIRKDCQTIDRKILTDIAVNASGNVAMKSMMEMFKRNIVVPLNNHRQRRRI